MHTEEMDSESVQVTTFQQGGRSDQGVEQGEFLRDDHEQPLGEHVPGPRDVHRDCDLVDGTTTVSGQSYHYIVKWKGQVFAEVGHRSW